ncbi:MAG: hypothetical protein KTR30_24380 [Saprospiraceae bacterium]|nr:hypothetical protein [Saprospiraceae bacterium]
MPLRLQFKKQKDGSAVLTCFRTDGSSTFTKIRPGLEIHDLAHYVVETTLGFKEAFYGLINQGFTVPDFELPREQRPTALIPENLPAESLQTEFIVNQLQIELYNSGEQQNFVPLLQQAMANRNLDFPTVLTTDKVLVMRQELSALVTKWQALPAGESISLEMEI